MSEEELTVEDRVSIHKFIRCLELLRDIDPNIKISEVRCLLTVALSEALTVREVGQRASIPTQSASTFLRALGEGVDRNGKPAKGLLVARPSPFDSRETLVRLSAKGAALMEEIRGVVFS